MEYTRGLVLFYQIRSNILFSFIWLLALWILIMIKIFNFYSVSCTAAYLMILYLLWVTFAGYLNLAIYLLNM